MFYGALRKYVDPTSYTASGFYPASFWHKTKKKSSGDRSGIDGGHSKMFRRYLNHITAILQASVL